MSPIIADNPQAIRLLLRQLTGVHYQSITKRIVAAMMCAGFISGMLIIALDFWQQGVLFHWPDGILLVLLFLALSSAFTYFMVSYWRGHHVFTATMASTTGFLGDPSWRLFFEDIAWIEYNNDSHQTKRLTFVLYNGTRRHMMCTSSMRTILDS